MGKFCKSIAWLTVLCKLLLHDILVIVNNLQSTLKSWFSGRIRIICGNSGNPCDQPVPLQISLPSSRHFGLQLLHSARLLFFAAHRPEQPRYSACDRHGTSWNRGPWTNRRCFSPAIARGNRAARVVIVFLTRNLNNSISN